MAPSKWLLAIPVIFISAPILMAQISEHEAAVYLKDGDIVEGTILEITPRAIKLDPPGPVSLRTILSSEIDSITMPELDTTLIYPLQQYELPPKIDNYLKKPRTGGSSSVTFAVSLTGGLSAFGLDYYKGFTHGPSFEGEVRLYFDLDERGSSHPFVAVSYRHSSAGVESGLDKTLLGYDSYGHPIYIILEPLSVRHLGIRVGTATKKKLTGASSQFSFHVGLSILTNSARARSEIVIDSQSTVLSQATVDDDKLGFDLAFSFIKGIRKGIGLRFSFGSEIFVTSWMRRAYYSYEYDEFQGGGILLVDGGLIFEF